MGSNPHIIGLAGSFGSGCSYIKDEILAKNGYTCFSLSNVLKQAFQQDTGKNPEEVPRHELQDYGDKKRQEKGRDYFAKDVLNKILSEHTADSSKKFVIDSIRNPAEIACFREDTNNFFLFGIYADENIRWERVKNLGMYNDDHSLFAKDDKRDKGKSNPDYGQHVEDCFYESDIVIRNNVDFSAVGNDEFNRFQTKFLKYLDLSLNPLGRRRPIKSEESLMAAAYAISQKSSCMRRKVGAILVDESENIISSGFNEVPSYETPCESEYKKCFREKTREEFFLELDKTLSSDKQKCDALKAKFKETFKILDYCRALHAEENTIVNLARNGSSVPTEKCTLYSTTYPCRMCANKIVQANIKNVVYLEPYPDKQGKVILEQAGVEATAFEGVTFKSYFRLYGEKK